MRMYNTQYNYETIIRGGLEYRTYRSGGTNPLDQFPKKYIEKKPSIHGLRFPKEIQEKILGWTKGANNFLIFLGKGGCGKTHFCAAISSYLWEARAEKSEKEVYELEEIKNEKGTVLDRKKTEKIIGYRIDLHHPEIEYYNVVDIYNLFKEQYSQNKSDAAIKEHIQKLEFLIIDDLGASANTAWQVQVMYEIIDYRYSNCLPTIITSNLSFEEIEKTFHQRIRSRLEDVGNNYFYDWEHDYRLHESE